MRSHRHAAAAAGSWGRAIAHLERIISHARGLRKRGLSAASLLLESALGGQYLKSSPLPILTHIHTYTPREREQTLYQIQSSDYARDNPSLTSAAVSLYFLALSRL